MKAALPAKGEAAFQAATSGLPTEHVTTSDALFVTAVIAAAWIFLWITWSLFSSFLSWAHQTQFQTARNLVVEVVFSAFVAVVLMYIFVS